tara:strand:- start:50 stop:397 length:348 start_codon:yes stop_codon:yes gene_type:complete
VEYPLEIFKALSEETRFRIIFILRNAKNELCECDIADILDVPQYNISKHLNILDSAGMIKKRKEGRWIYLSLSDSLDKFKSSVINSLGHLNSELINEDLTKMKHFLISTSGNRCS